MVLDIGLLELIMVCFTIIVVNFLKVWFKY